MYAVDARADDLEQFEKARSSYEAHDYETAAARFGELVEGPALQLQSRPLVLESRKYLGASYLFLGREADAERQFEILLRNDPEYRIDPVAFPQAVYVTFEHVRAQLQTEQQQRDARVEEQKRRQQQTEQMRRQQLEMLANTEVVERVNSRWVAAIPFGVGQFKNGDPRSGMALAITEGLLAAISITTFALHEALRNEQPNDNKVEEAQRAEKGFRYANWASTGLLVATMIGGIIDAEVRFRPVVRTTRQRQPGATTQRGPTSLRLGLSPLGIAANLRF